MNTENLFTGFNSTDSYAILFIMFISFLLGFLVAYLLRSFRIRKLKKELENVRKELDQAGMEVLAVREQMELKDADLKRINFEKEELMGKMNRLEKEKTELYNNLYQANADQEKVKTSIANYIDTIDGLNNQIADLQSTNTTLLENLDAIEKELEEERKERQERIQANGMTPEREQDFAQMQSELEDYRSRLKDLELKYEDRLIALERTMPQLANENASLRNKLEDGSEEEPGLVLEKAVEPLEGTSGAAVAVEPELVVASDKSVLKEKIILDDQEKDDLTLIQGVGPFLEKKLNGIGIFTFEQISQFDAAKIEQVTEEIAFFPGRIKKDDWVGQAKELMRMKKVSPDKFKEKTEHPADMSDLKIIEGIGPKIEQILKNADILNWEDLADTSPKYLEIILADAGDAFKSHDPGTWPTQARLAARGEWNLLREYQEDLKGGREAKE